MYICALDGKRASAPLCPKNQFPPPWWKLGAGIFTCVENAYFRDFSVFSLGRGREEEHRGLGHRGSTIPSSQDPQRSFRTERYILQALTMENASSHIACNASQIIDNDSLHHLELPELSAEFPASYHGREKEQSPDPFLTPTPHLWDLKIQ